MAYQQTARVLTHMGYAVRKDSLSEQQLQDIRKQLTVAPKTNAKFAKQADPFSLLLESSQRLYLPRQWALKTLGPAEADILVDGDKLPESLTFGGKPYDYQQEIVDSFLQAGANGLICVPCGRGKTFMAIWTAMRLGRRFLIVVDKEFLLQQWSGELRALVPGIRIGVLQENKKQIEPAKYDCTIAMIQTLVQREFSEMDFRSFGFTIFDECHHLGAAQFSRALLKVQTKNMLGLSATPTRDDGLTKVFEWFLGEPVYWEKTREPDPDVIVRKVEFESEEESYTKLPTDYHGETILARLLTQVVECEERNLVIDGLLRDLLKEPARKILVLSERKEHLKRIESGLPKGTAVGYYIGGMKEEVREEGARTATVLLGTYAMASEAMNIKTLNTMIMASPRKKIEQSTGRILRTRKDERAVDPVIIDVVDSHDVYHSQWEKRKAYYKKCHYKIQIWDSAKRTWTDEPVKTKSRRALQKEAEEPAGRCMILDD